MMCLKVWGKGKQTIPKTRQRGRGIQNQGGRINEKEREKYK